MAEESVIELPQIVFQKTVITPDRHNYINLEVRGNDLEECQRHFDELLKKDICKPFSPIEEADMK
jgi:hypothetical protein